MRDIAILLAVLACLGVPVGLSLALTSQAPLGVALIGACCLLVGLSRIVQAGHHHREHMRMLHGRDGAGGRF